MSTNTVLKKQSYKKSTNVAIRYDYLKGIPAL